MKSLIVVTCLLAASTVVRGIDEDTVIPQYIEYLMPDLTPCADQFHMLESQVTNVQQPIGVDERQMGCFKACVMKRMEILIGLDFHLEPIYKMIDVVHADNAEDREFVRKLAAECVSDIKDLTDECDIGTLYTECYISKLFD